MWNMPANSMGGLEHVADPYKVCALGAHWQAEASAVLGH